jgi:uncharacterized protein YebE (UPF0316 family)
MFAFLSHSPYYSWLILPLLIFASRICDVSLGTIRIIFIARGIRHLAPVIGFFEVFIWLLAISQIMQHNNHLEYYIAYAAGFAAGTFVGMVLENKIAIGISLIRIITTSKGSEIMDSLNDLGHGVTCMDAHQLVQPVKILLAVVKRKDLTKAIHAIKAANPLAVYTIEDVRSVSARSPRRICGT